MVRPAADPASLPDTCYCRHCLERFAAASPSRAALPLDDPAAAAAWIRAHDAEAWVRFKARDDHLAGVGDHPGGARGAAAHHDLGQRRPLARRRVRRRDHRIAGQDREALGGMADFLSPMCYSFMLYRPPEWIASVVEETAGAGRSAVLPSVQVARPLPHRRAVHRRGVRGVPARRAAAAVRRRRAVEVGAPRGRAGQARRAAPRARQRFRRLTGARSHLDGVRRPTSLTRKRRSVPGRMKSTPSDWGSGGDVRRRRAFRIGPRR